MAPTYGARAPSPEHLRQVSSSLSSLSIRDVASSASSLCSIFAMIMASDKSLSRRALISLASLPTDNTYTSSTQHLTSLPLLKRQNAILAIPTTYAGLNDGPSPGAVVGIVLGSVFGFLLCLYVLLLTVQFFGFGASTTLIEEEVVIKRKSSKSKSRSRSKKSVKSEHISEHVSEHISIHNSPPPPSARSRRETVVEVHETIFREHRSPTPSPPPPPHEDEEVIVMEEESSHMSEDIVEVIEEQSSIVSPEPAPPSRKPSQNRRSGFRTVDPAEFGGGERPMRRLSRRS